MHRMVMSAADLLQILARGEDSRHQFKRDETNADSIAWSWPRSPTAAAACRCLARTRAAACAGWGAANVRRLNQLISNAASQNVRPPIPPTTEKIQTAQGVVTSGEGGVAGRGYTGVQRPKFVEAVIQARATNDSDQSERSASETGRGLLTVSRLPRQHASHPRGLDRDVSNFTSACAAHS